MSTEEEAGLEEQPAVKKQEAAKKSELPLPSSLQAIVGALLFASPSPLTAAEIRNAIRAVEAQEGDDPEVMEVYSTCTASEVQEALRGVEKELERSQLGVRLVCAANAYRLQTDPSCGRHVRSLLKVDRPNRLSRAALETLAIVAYRQPIAKSEIEQVRGVGVDTILRSLVELELVRIVGKSELPGHPFLYGTTQLFLEHFGLASLGELNGMDPTLQRSNPKERAQLYRKKEASQPELPEVDKASETAVPETDRPEEAEKESAADATVQADESPAESAVEQGSAPEPESGPKPPPEDLFAGEDDEEDVGIITPAVKKIVLKPAIKREVF